MRRDASFRYQVVLAALLVLMVYDGAVRKWLLPGAEQLVFIAKDVLLVLALGFAWLMRSGKAPATLHPQVRLLLVLYAAWVVMQVFNPELPNFMVGLWGLKSHLLYAGLIVLLPLAWARLDDAFAMLEKIYPWLVLPVCSLAFAQVLAPADSFLNQQVRDGTQGIAYFGDAGLVRVTGTFSYISGMAAFVQCSCLLGIALYLGGARSRLFLVGLGFALAALPATGSRAVVAVVVVGAGLLLLGSLVARLVGPRTVARVSIAMVVLGAISLYTQDAAWQAFQQRVEGARADESRTITAFTNAFEFMDVAGLTGFGTGAANLGAVALTPDVLPFSWLPVGNQFEEESGRIVLELGIIGWLLSLSLRVGLLLWAMALTVGSHTRSGRLAGVLALPVMALGVQQGNGVFAVPLAAVFYWFCVTLMAMARYQDRQIQVQRAQQAKAQWQGMMKR